MTLFSDLCRGFNTEVAMKKAMENVEKHYAVVGILEELNKTLTVLEHYVPRFFKGALNTYWSKLMLLYFQLYSSAVFTNFSFLTFQTRFICILRSIGTFTSLLSQNPPKKLFAKTSLEKLNFLSFANNDYISST